MKIIEEDLTEDANEIAKINEEAILTASKNGQEQNEKVITSEEDFEELFIPEEFVEDIEEKIIPEESLSEEFSVDYLDMETVEEPEVDFGSIDIEELLKQDKKIPSIEILKYLNNEEIKIKIYVGEDHKILNIEN